MTDMAEDIYHASGTLKRDFSRYVHPMAFCLSSDFDLTGGESIDRLNSGSDLMSFEERIQNLKRDYSP